MNSYSNSCDSCSPNPAYLGLLCNAITAALSQDDHNDWPIGDQYTDSTLQQQINKQTVTVTCMCPPWTFHTTIHNHDALRLLGLPPSFLLLICRVSPCSKSSVVTNVHTSFYTINPMNMDYIYPKDCEQHGVYYALLSKFSTHTLHVADLCISPLPGVWRANMQLSKVLKIHQM